MSEDWRTEHVYEKCARCELFVEQNEEAFDGQGNRITQDWPIAEYIHLHRGDEADTLLDESHEPAPSGMKANLPAWKAYGPVEMRRRFTDHCPTCGEPTGHTCVTEGGSR